METENNIVVNDELEPIQPLRFTRAFVIKHTKFFMKRPLTKVLVAIDRSIEYAFSRVPEFEGDIDKSNEVFQTLADLHELRRKVLAIVNF